MKQVKLEDPINVVKFPYSEWHNSMSNELLKILKERLCNFKNSSRN